MAKAQLVRAGRPGRPGQRFESSRGYHAPMAFLYILQSESTERFYVGSTADLGRRREEHNRGQTRSTRARGPWKLVYQESYQTLLEARRRELEIKRWKSSKMIEALIREAVG